MTVLIFTATGRPRPKGSLRHVGGGRLVEQVDNGDWRTTVQTLAAAAMRRGGWECLTGAAGVDLAFTVPKPKSAPKTRRTLPVTRTSGDLDKLSRLILDVLVDVGALHDDSQVVELHVRKVYPGEHLKALPLPGVRVALWPLNPRPVDEMETA